MTTFTVVYGSTTEITWRSNHKLNQHRAIKKGLVSSIFFFKEYFRLFGRLDLIRLKKTAVGAKLHLQPLKSGVTNNHPDISLRRRKKPHWNQFIKGTKTQLQWRRFHCPSFAECVKNTFSIYYFQVINIFVNTVYSLLHSLGSHRGKKRNQWTRAKCGIVKANRKDKKSSVR